ncbi:tape measure protein [Bifidobacterium longum]|uniref:tape measure protein n=1 Tax=Bifidobacterium longum TaxID=216816 RepID=UPI00257014DE|nr:tape measure protein [Bifidobacterium longum]MDL5506500.1 tape measure protein [Bifidobacterium longum]
MVELAHAYVQIVPSMSGVGRAIQDAFGSAGDKGGAQAGKNFTSGFSAKIGAVAGVTASVFNKVAGVVASSLNSAIGRADQMNNFPKVMKNLGYSSEDAAASIKKISAALDGLPTTSSAMTGMVQQLAPLTSNLDEATDIALAFNNAMLAGGASTIEQENALTQYTQMLSAGKVDMQAWRSIQAAMPGQLNQVAEAMMGAGHNANDLYEAMKDGTYSFDDFNKTVMRLNKQGFAQYASFAQQARDATQGIGTAFENVRNRVAKAVQKVIEAIGVENIAGAINDFSSQFGKIGDAAANMVTGVKNWLGQAAQAAKPLVSIWQGDFAKLGLYLTGLGANVAAFGKSLLDVITNGGGMQSFLVGLNNVISALVNWWIALTRNVSIFIGTLADTGGVQAFLAALGELWQGLTQLFQGLQDAATGLLEIGENGGAAAAAGKLVGDAFKVATPIVKALAGTLQSVGEWASEHGDIVRAAIIGIGTAFAAVKGYQALNSGLQALTGTMNTVTTAAKGISNGIMLMTDLGGPVAMLKQMAGGLSLVKTAQTAWSTATKMATAVQGAFNAVIAANPIGAIVVAVAAVVAALVWFFTQTEVGRRAWAAFTSWLSETWAALVEGAKAIWNGLGEFLANLWATITGGVTGAWTSITTFLSGVWTGISTTATTIFNGIRDFIVNVFTVIGALIVAPLQAIRNGINTVFGWILSFITQQMNSTNTVWSTIWTAIYNVVNTIFTLISGYISTVVNAIRTVIVVFLSLLKGDWQGAWDAIKSFFTTTWDGIKAFLSNILDGIKAVWTTVWTAISTFFTDVWNRIVAFFTPIINGIRNTIGNVLNAIKSVWTSIWNAVKSVASTIWNAISGVVSTYIQNVSNTISTVLNAISGVWTSVWNSVSSFLGNIWHGITSAVSNGIQNVSNTVDRIKSTVLGAVSGAGQWLYDTGRQIISGLINGIGGAFQWVRNTISNLGSSLVGWAKSVLGIHSPSRIFRDEVGKWIPAGMAQGIDKASGLVADSIDGLTDMVPTVSLKTDTSRLETPLAYHGTVNGGRIAYTMDEQAGEYATKQDIIDAIDAALAAGITLNLNDRGGEVMAGKLAKPMSYELNSLAMRGR